MNNKYGKIKKFATTTILILLMTSAVLTVTGSVKAQTTYTNMQDGGSLALPDGVTPDVSIETQSWLSVTPGLIGVNQDILVNIWTTPTIHVSRYMSDYAVIITDPDGNEDVVTLDSYYADSTAWFNYKLDKVGDWTIKFEFPGGYFPAGNYTTQPGAWTGSGGVVSFPSSCYYEPSVSEEITVVVQEEMVYSWQAVPLPTDYWTRPVTGENREWWPILGHYPATGIVGGGNYWPEDTNKYMSNYDYIPYVEGPTTAHIVWQKEYMIGGLIGGEARQVTGVLNGLSGYGYPTIIYAGRCYETYTKPGTATATTYWKCYDLRTGEIYWDRALLSGEPTPSFVEYASQGSEVPGATAREGKTAYLVAISSDRLIKWDPYTGNVVVNVTGPSGLSGSTLYAYPNVLSVQNLGGGNYRLINWTIANNAGQEGTYTGRWTETVIDNFTARIMNNITWPFSSVPATTDYEAGIAVNVGSVTPTSTQTATGQTIMAASITTGQLLWNITIDESFFSSGINIADHGKYAALMKTGETWCWDLSTGQIAWKAKITSNPWGSFGAYNSMSAYGLYIMGRYDGVSAIDWETGEIAWTFTAETPYSFETPYETNGTEVYSFHTAGMIADGMVYIANTEHTPTQPIARGWRLFCINATTGEGIWNITTAAGVADSRTFQGSIADGYLTYVNDYTGVMSVYGKGQSKTTVLAPQVEITAGTNAIISGTVLDLSPAQEGTACVSADSMSAWMEYLHMGHNMPDNVVGVPVSIDAVDPNGNYVHIADVTSDASGTFSYTWMPEIAGDYTITATFMGDGSYGSSWAETHATVVEAPAETPAATPTTFDAINNTTFAVGVVAIIIAVALAAVLTLRKRP